MCVSGVGAEERDCDRLRESERSRESGKEIEKAVWFLLRSVHLLSKLSRSPASKAAVRQPYVSLLA